MGVKMIGAFCDAIKDTNLIDPLKYLAGFQIIPDEIPGFDAIAFNEVKISMRVSPLSGRGNPGGKSNGTQYICFPKRQTGLEDFPMPAIV